MASAPDFDWFIGAWLATQAMTQSELQRRAGWSKRKASDLVGGAQPFNRHSLNDAARALGVMPFELLLHPEDAYALRRMRDSALSLAAESRARFTPAGPEDALTGNRKAG